MKLLTYDDGKVGRVEGEEVVRLDVPTMREYFERGGADDTTERSPLEAVKRRAPIVPKKFFHTAGNFREHEEESKNVDWSHAIAPWINFFQNVDAIVGPDEPVIYPEHLTEELDYELELAVVLKKAGKWFSPEEAADYIGGYVIFNDITARDIQRGEMRSGVFSFCKAIDTFCPLRAVDRHPRRDPRPAQPRDGASCQRRGTAGVAFEPHERDDPGDPLQLLRPRLFRRRRALDRHRRGRRRLQVEGRADAPLSEAR